MFEASTQIYIYKTILTIIVFITCMVIPFIKKNKSSNSITPFVFSIFCIMFIGWRDWMAEDYYGDSIRYGTYYLRQYGYSYIDTDKDIGFDVFSHICYSLGLSVDQYFVMCSCLYIIPLLIVVIRVVPENKMLAMLMIVGSMSFSSYGYNGIRNGIATSILLLAISYYKKLKVFLPLFFVAISFHKSVIIPASAFLIAKNFKNPKLYLIIWFCSIPLSFVISTFVKDYLLQFQFIADRTSGYFTNEAELGKFNKTGFRWDFILYGSLPIMIGYYYILKKKIADNFYILILSIYTLTNAFWVLINEVPFSNRFAYLSWFVMPVVIIYPFIKFDNRKKQALILFIYYAITLIL